MLKNLLAATAIVFALAISANAQNKYFLTYYNKAEKLYEAKDYINFVNLQLPFFLQCSDV